MIINGVSRDQRITMRVPSPTRAPIHKHHFDETSRGLLPGRLPKSCQAHVPGHRSRYRCRISRTIPERACEFVVPLQDIVQLWKPHT